RYFQSTTYNTLKTGELRAQFIIESVKDLKNSLQDLGGDLLVKIGKPEEILPELVKEYQVSEVYHHREVASEETEISSHVEDALWKKQINLKHFIGHTLYHKEDLPFPIKDIPDLFSKFRKKVEREGTVRQVFESPERINVPSNLAASEVPDLKDLGFESEKTPLEVIGGESEGLRRLDEYLWESDFLQNYKQRRNLLHGFYNSSRLSPWLSLGCLSPRRVYWELKKYERKRGAADSISLMLNELLFRDYFRFMFKKHSTAYFIEDENLLPLDKNQQLAFEQWKKGVTGEPLIDASMRELNTTGYIPAKGRQSVASFLIHELNIPWFYGAAYFEEKLIDYAPASNWGNWALLAGVGSPQKEIKPILDLQKQAKESDPKGDYIKNWLPADYFAVSFL
ncbi:DASH family cryptochrome, partial [Pseudoxanthomonas sp. SGD-10]